MDAWLTVQRLKRAKLQEDREAARKAKAKGRDWRDPEDGVEIGMGRYADQREAGKVRRERRDGGRGWEHWYEEGGKERGRGKLREERGPGADAHGQRKKMPICNARHTWATKTVSPRYSYLVLGLEPSQSV